MGLLDASCGGGRLAGGLGGELQKQRDRDETGWGDGGGEFGLDIVYLNSASEKFSHLALVLIGYLGKPTRDHTRQAAAQTQGKTKT